MADLTSHRTTNIYADHLCKYKIRTSDDAMDIQVNDVKEDEVSWWTKRRMICPPNSSL